MTCIWTQVPMSVICALHVWRHYPLNFFHTFHIRNKNSCNGLDTHIHQKRESVFSMVLISDLTILFPTLFFKLYGWSKKIQILVWVEYFSLWILIEISYKSRFPVQRVTRNVGWFRQSKFFVLKYLHEFFILGVESVKW